MTNKATAAQMLNSHAIYTEHIDDFIEGKVEEPGATSHTACMLGSWYWGPAQKEPDLNVHPRFVELGEIHRKYHEVTADAIDFAKAGSSAAAREKITESYRLFAQISQILMEFDYQINMDLASR